MVTFILNNRVISTTKPTGTPLLEFIRYHQHLTGTKTGCNEGDCGACTVLIGELVHGTVTYKSYTACLTPLLNVHGKHVVTVEGLNADKAMTAALGSTLSPVQQAMHENSATQCGFCTPGFVVSLSGYCLSNQPSTRQGAIASIDGNICRCTGYKSIERAAMQVAGLMENSPVNNRISYLVENHFLPHYFNTINQRLQVLQVKEDEQSSIAHPELVVGGGTDLYVQKHEDIKDLPVKKISFKSQGRGIYKQGQMCIVEPQTTVTDLLESKLMQQYFPRLDKYGKLISSTQIRNMATIAGNFINASPIGDFTIFFLALNAEVVLSDHQQTRVLPLAQLYNGYKTLSKSKEEHIEQIRFTLPETNWHFNFEKVCKRTHLDIASVNSAIQLQVTGDVINATSLSAGGVAAIPKLLVNTAEFLTGKSISNAVIEEACSIAQAEITPISDARGSETYKRLLLNQLMKAHFIELFPSLVHY